jgi:hypothetical protein
MRAYGSLLVLNAHPFLSGRASRVRALRSLIDQARAWGDIEIATAGDIADRVLADPCATRRRHDPLQVDSRIYPHW